MWGIPAQKLVTQSFDVFFDLHLNKRLVNNREAGDLRRHRVHYYVIVKFAPWCHLSNSHKNQSKAEGVVGV